MAVPRHFRHGGPVLVRATTCPAGVVPPSGLDLNAPEAVCREGAAWLARVWARNDVREAIETASPVLAGRIAALMAADLPSVRRTRRTVASVASYLLRWERRATPFGAFAGIAPAAVGPAAAQLGTEHRLVIRPDGEWITSLIGRVERDRALRAGLEVVTDNTGIVRDDRFIVARRAEVTARSPGPLRDASVRLTPAVAFALDQAAALLRLDRLAERMRLRFPAAAAAQILELLHGLIDGGFLITGLRPASTEADPLGHLVGALRAAGADDPERTALAGPGELLDRLEGVNARIVQHNAAPPGHARAALLRAAIAEEMRNLAPGPGHVLAADLRLDARISLPERVMEEAERAASVLLRLSTQPFGTAAWMDYHSRFRARYGHGALVEVLDLVADSGLGYPHGFLGAPRARPAWRTLTERDAAFLAMIQRAMVDSAGEITLTDADVQALAIGNHDDVVVPPRVELGVALEAASTAAIDRGDFTLRVVAAPRAHTSMIGRHTYLLDGADRANVARTYAADEKDVVVAQLSFPPRRPHNDNVVRVPPHAGLAVLPLAEHPGGCTPGAPGRRSIALDDLAVTADADQMYLVQRSSGRRVVVHIPHALDTTVQTPPLARFLAEVGDARSAVFGPLDLGAARTLPFVPRVRYGRTVLSPARWLLSSEEPGASGSREDWAEGLRQWRVRWGVPARVVLCKAELRLPLDLSRPLDRSLLRLRLERDEQVELREDSPPGASGWTGRTTELVIPMVSSSPASRKPPMTASPGKVHQPGDAALLRAHLVGNPARFDLIITRHLPRFIRDLGTEVRRWWLSRHRDLIRVEADQYLVVVLRLAGASQYGCVAAHLAAFVDGLRGRGLATHLTLAPAIEHPGRYGHGAALDAAEEVFAADSAAAVAQIAFAETARVPAQAVAAASMAHIARAFAPDPLFGYRRLAVALQHHPGRSEPDVREQTLHLAATTDEFAAVRALPGGDVVASAWRRRADTLTTYHRLLERQRDPAAVLGTLLHDHHVRTLGLDPDHEATTNRLARAAALRHLALARTPAGEAW
ncbi:lantibiotic dehydratase [Actinomadura nitritigenes]|uniref:lantibiotic dehydratase n=1 Tax=Actinomadura nitritigenes TaxID=134602 RepID=UPI0036A676C2